jgi:hypothetical protein
MESMNLDDAKKVFATPRCGNLTKPEGYCEAEVLVRKILDETPDAIKLFNSLEEMIEYTREALAAKYTFDGKIIM